MSDCRINLFQALLPKLLIVPKIAETDELWVFEVLSQDLHCP